MGIYSGWPLSRSECTLVLFFLREGNLGSLKGGINQMKLQEYPLISEAMLDWYSFIQCIFWAHVHCHVLCWAGAQDTWQTRLCSSWPHGACTLHCTEIMFSPLEVEIFYTLKRNISWRKTVVFLSTHRILLTPNVWVFPHPGILQLSAHAEYSMI